MPDATHATLELDYKVNQSLKSGETLDTFRSFVAVHQRDYFQSFQDYSAVMQKRGHRIDPAPESAFGAIWCAWGYGKTFTPAQVEQRATQQELDSARRALEADPGVQGLRERFGATLLPETVRPVK